MSSPEDSPSRPVLSVFQPAETSTAASVASYTDLTDLEKAEALATRAISLPRASRTKTFFRGRQEFQHQYENVKTGREVIVEYDSPDDPYNPQNWPLRKKMYTTLLYGLTTFCATWASAIYASGSREVAEEFHVHKQVAVLGTTLLLFGFGAGPLLFAPVSEMYGRKMAVLPTYMVAVAFTFGTAAAKDVQTIMLTRFFTGVFASAPITCSGGALSDIWNPLERGTALQFYALTVLGGPTLAPIVGGAIVYTRVSWRWLEYMTGIMMVTVLILDIIFLDESYSPMLLVYKARRLRLESGNWALHAKHEEHEFTIKEMGEKFLIRPIQMMLTPVLFFVSLYASFLYGLLYLTLGAFPIVFEELRGWDQLDASLSFLALFFGIVTGAGINLLNNIVYGRRFRENGERAVPEARLYPMMFGAVLFAAGLFVFAWTSEPGVHWVAPMIGIYLVGISFITIFQAALNYLIDTFQKYAASAVAATTFMRSAFAGAFPIVVGPMYHNLGAEWAGSLLGFMALAMIPIPFIFYVYGTRIRSRGKYTKALTGA